MNNRSIKDYHKQRINKKCPYCNGILSIVIHGLVQDDYLKQLREENISFYNAGCCCYGDDRDEVFYCPSCKIKLDERLRRITLITCPRVSDYCIRQEECCDEINLKSKYILKSKKYCDACKIIKMNNDEEYRKAAHIIGISEDIIEQVIDKKNSNLRLKSNMLYKRYLCEEDEVVHRLKYWDN